MTHSQINEEALWRCQCFDSSLRETWNREPAKTQTAVYRTPLFTISRLQQFVPIAINKLTRWRFQSSYPTALLRLSHQDISSSRTRIVIVSVLKLMQAIHTYMSRVKNNSEDQIYLLVNNNSNISVSFYNRYVHLSFINKTSLSILFRNHFSP